MGWERVNNPTPDDFCFGFAYIIKKAFIGACFGTLELEHFIYIQNKIAIDTCVV